MSQQAVPSGAGPHQQKPLVALPRSRGRKTASRFWRQGKALGYCVRNAHRRARGTHQPFFPLPTNLGAFQPRYEAIVEDLLREPASAGKTYWHMATRRDAGVSITMSQHVVPSEGGLAAKSLDDPPRSRGQKPP